MQLASHGLRAATRNASNFVPGAGSSRGIHIPTYIRLHPRLPTPGQTQKLFTQSRNFLARFFNHLTAPGLRIPTTPSVSHSLHSTARGYASVQQGFSFPVRTALARPLQTNFLPRAPTAVPRCVTQVGLGTARNFSSGRPIFQNLVENVPIAGRALYEADWEIKGRKEGEKMRKSLKGKSSKKSTGKEMLKPRIQDIILQENKPASKQSSVEAELDQYFAAPVTSDVTTCLLIPLAPTPTSRVPLDPFTSTNPSLLPLREIASVHASHEIHSLRVSSLFSRLDAANVWERGVQCSAFSHGGGAESVCTMLKVEFVGWTKAEVRSVIGESGTGWCVLEEVKTSPGDGHSAFSDIDDDDLSSDASSVLSGMVEDSGRASPLEVMNANMAVDPAQSFVLPTLDFSSSFLSSHSQADTLSRTSSGVDLFSNVQSEPDFDPWLDSDSSSDGGLSDTDSWVEPPSTNGWFGFSSQSPQRAEVDLQHDEPRESIFY
jgi:hypothetical protein